MVSVSERERSLSHSSCSLWKSPMPYKPYSVESEKTTFPLILPPIVRHSCVCVFVVVSASAFSFLHRRMQETDVLCHGKCVRLLGPRCKPVRLAWDVTQVMIITCVLNIRPKLHLNSSINQKVNWFLCLINEKTKCAYITWYYQYVTLINDVSYSLN